MTDAERHAHPLYALLDAAPTTILIVRGDGVIDYCNAAAQVCFGYPRDELIGLTVDDLVPGDRAARHAGQRNDFIAGPSQASLHAGRQVLGKRKDGSIFPVETSLIPVQTSKGLWTLVSAVDISERLADLKRHKELTNAYLTLAQMNQAIVRAPDEVVLFSETCRIAVEQGGYAGAWVGRAGPGTSVECVAKAGEVDEFLKLLTVNTDPADVHGQGPTGRVLRDGVSRYVQQIAADPMMKPWHDLAARFEIEATATLALRCAGRPVATLTLYSKTPQLFDTKVHALLDGMADNVSFALDGFAAVAQLRDLAVQRQYLSGRLVEAQEAERARIAADVHDDSVQALAAMGLRLGVLQRRLAANAPEDAATVGQLLESLGGVSAGLRDLLFELEPAGDDVEMIDMLQQAGAHIFDDSDVRCTIHQDQHVPENRDTLSLTVRGQVLRIVKEALINARNHAHASEVVVNVEPGADGFRVLVTDNGAGFEVGRAAPSPGHRGLVNMFDRAAVSGGTCEVESSTSGTAVRLWMPYDAKLGGLAPIR